MLGVLLTKWTIRLALACFVAYLAGWLVVGSRREGAAPWPRLARWVWTLGCLLFVVHVACAFQYYHGWSHAAAFEKTAAETEQLLGVRFGEGIYFSYLFLLLWVVDVIGLWVWPAAGWQRFPTNSPRPVIAAVQWTLIGYLFFIAFNGAIVFEDGPTRWIGIGACLVLGGLALKAAYNCKCGVRISECGMPSQINDL
jgi:hypothetical protein